VNSSISSSDDRPFRRILVRLVLVLLVVFVGLEIVTRALLLPRSRDFVRFAGYPRRAEELVHADGLRIAFIGNSAIQRGLDPTQFVAQLPNPTRRPVHVDLFVADGAEVNTWHYLMKRAFWQRDLNPNWFVVTFFGNALEDGNTIEIGRLALFFTEPADWPDVCALDLPTYSERAEFVLSSGWATFAARDRIRKRVLAEVVPDYKDFVEDLHALRAHAVPPTSERTCRVLERFLAAAREHGNRICFVAFPTRPSGVQPVYEINPKVPRLIHAAGMALLDLRSVPGLAAEHYEDDYHLTPAGAAIYTRHFTQAISPIIEH
jgi:hypothetical protein